MQESPRKITEEDWFEVLNKATKLINSNVDWCGGGACPSAKALICSKLIKEFQNGNYSYKLYEKLCRYTS